MLASCSAAEDVVRVWDTRYLSTNDSHVSLLDRANRPHKTLKHETQDIDIPKPRHKQLDPTSVRHNSSSNHNAPANQSHSQSQSRSFPPSSSSSASLLSSRRTRH